MLINLILIFILICFNLLFFNNNNNLIYIIIALELLLLLCSLIFLIIAFNYDDFLGALYSLIILILAGCESALILGIIVKYYNKNKTINIT